MFFYYSFAITDTDNTPPVDNYTVNNYNGVNITTNTCDYTIPVSEDNIYTVEMSVNNIIERYKTTADPLSKILAPVFLNYKLV